MLLDFIALILKEIRKHFHEELMPGSLFVLIFYGLFNKSYLIIFIHYIKQLNQRWALQIAMEVERIKHCGPSWFSNTVEWGHTTEVEKASLPPPFLGYDYLLMLNFWWGHIQFFLIMQEDGNLHYSYYKHEYRELLGWERSGSEIPCN